MGGCQLDNTDNHANTALILAADNGHFEIVSALIEAGCNLDNTDNENNTALILAAYHNHFKIAKVLIEAGCQLDIADNEGSTAFDLTDDSDIVRALVDHGCCLKYSTHREDVKAIFREHEIKRATIHASLENHSLEFPQATMEEICDFLLPRRQ